MDAFAAPILLLPRHRDARIRRLRRVYPLNAASIFTLAAPLARRVSELQLTRRDHTRVLIGVAGVPGSGKSTVCAAAAAQSGCGVVAMDGFHYTRAELDKFPDPEHAHARRGAPFTFNARAFSSCLRKVRAGGSVLVPRFDHATKDPEPGGVLEASVRAVLVEGNYLLLDEDGWAEVRETLDEVWYIDTPIDVAMGRVQRRLVRDIGFSEAEASERVRCNDEVNAKLVQESGKRADFVICEDGLVIQNTNTD